MRQLLSILSIALVLAIVGCSSNPTPAPAPVAIPVTQPSSSASSSSSTQSTVAPAQTGKVEVWDDFFRPANITVTVGTQVTWINVGIKKHTVTSGNLFDQDINNPGDTFSFTFDKPGVIQYYCVQHSLSETEGMVGTITVVAR